MDKIKLIYNPHSGDGRFRDALDDCAEVFYNAGCETHLVRAVNKDVLDASVAAMDDNYTALVAAGGDGTINLVVNALKRHGKNIPLGIIPAGTANDFASHLKIPKDPVDAAKSIANGVIIPADLGRVGGQYFINVCGAGLFINVSHSVDTQAKNAFGKLAYYVKGLSQLQNITPLLMRITTPSQVWEEEFYLVLAFNGAGAGGFERLAPNSAIDDGLLDFVAFRAMPLMDMAAILIKVLAGEHVNDRSVLFLREAAIKVECIGYNHLDTDIDGERGPEMPLEITCEKGALQLIVPPTFQSGNESRKEAFPWRDSRSF